MTTDDRRSPSFFRRLFTRRVEEAAAAGAPPSPAGDPSETSAAAPALAEAAATPPGADAGEPGTDATQPGTGMAEPETDATQPGTGMAEPETDATQPGIGMAEPETGTIQPMTGATGSGAGSAGCEPGPATLIPAPRSAADDTPTVATGEGATTASPADAPARSTGEPVSAPGEASLLGKVASRAGESASLTSDHAPPTSVARSSGEATSLTSDHAPPTGVARSSGEATSFTGEEAGAADRVVVASGVAAAGPGAREPLGRNTWSGDPSLSPTDSPVTFSTLPTESNKSEMSVVVGEGSAMPGGTDADSSSSRGLPREEPPGDDTADRGSVAFGHPVLAGPADTAPERGGSSRATAVEGSPDTLQGSTAPGAPLSAAEDDSASARDGSPADRAEGDSTSTAAPARADAAEEGGPRRAAAGGRDSAAAGPAEGGDGVGRGSRAPWRPEVGEWRGIVLVTGTDTEVGKTVATAAVAAAAQASGLRVAVIKPGQTGILTGEPTDIEVVSRLAAPETVRTLAEYPEPMAPLAAATIAEMAPLELYEVVDAVRTEADKHDLVLVEGAGGLLVPMGVRPSGEAWTLADLATTLGVGALVVARAGLGTLNHTALTLEALHRRGVPAGVIIGAWPAEPQLVHWANLSELVPHLVGALPEGAGRMDPGVFRRSAPGWLTPALFGVLDNWRVWAEESG